MLALILSQEVAVMSHLCAMLSLCSACLNIRTVQVKSAWILMEMAKAKKQTSFEKVGA